MFAALTAAGLSAAAGLNAYIPFLLVALIARFTDVINLPSGFSWVSSWWAIGLCVILLAVDVVIDKIPALDSVNDLIGTVIRPASGAVVFAATAAAANLDHSHWMVQHPWIGLIGGAVVAGIFHTGKTAARPVANVATVGMAAPILSAVEEVTAVCLSLAAIFVPILGFLLLVLCLFLMWRLWRRVVEARERRLARASSAGVA